jgi:hypothetical protein
VRLEQGANNGEDGILIQRADPIFIHGILGRSGTNFLWRLLLLHPDCAPQVEPVREDLLLEHSDHLLSFLQSVQAAWDPRWGEVTSELQDRLLAALGDGLVSFLWFNRERRLVTKSPSVVHLERFFRFFPEARLLVLIRDGRAVTQSAMDTLGWEFERAVRRWAQGADEIGRFRLANRHLSERWRLVRYEDLVEDLDRELRAILTFAGLDPDRYDFDAARELPVQGSSSFFGPGRSSVHWEPVKKDSSFDPIRRWRSWTPKELERFEWLAGAQTRALGYESKLQAPLRKSKVAGHVLLDWRWLTRQAVGEAVRTNQTRVKKASRPIRRRLGLVR